jgi:hypothetical protein
VKDKKTKVRLVDLNPKPPKKPEPDVIVGEGGRTDAGSGMTSLIMRCPKAYQYDAVRKIRVPQTQMPPHFAVGILFAAMRREWFGRRFDTSEATWQHLKAKCQAEAELQHLPLSPKDEAFALALMAKYIEHWSARPRPRPIAAEYQIGPAPLVPGDPPHLYRTAKLDDLSYYPEAGGALCIGEAKTTSADVGSVVREYELHVQPLLYTALYMAAPEGQARWGKVAGVVLDVTCKPMEGKKPSFHRVAIEIRPEAVQQFVESARYYVELASRITWDTNAMRTYRCTEMHGRMRVDCKFKDLCRFGSAAAGKYVLEDGRALRRYKPVPGAEKMPWE